MPGDNVAVGGGVDGADCDGAGVTVCGAGGGTDGRSGCGDGDCGIRGHAGECGTAYPHPKKLWL